MRHFRGAPAHVNGQLFDSLLEAQVLTEDWRVDYNVSRPHSAHGWKAPATFAEEWITTHQPQLA
jgi:putative transposase